MLIIGKITGFHGFKGELKVPYSERLYKNLSILKTVYVFIDDNKSEELEIESFKLHKQNILLKFKEYSNKNDIQHLLGATIKQDKTLLAPLDEEEYFIDDLVGLSIVDNEENVLGSVNSIFFNKGVDDLIELITPDGKKYLIPFTEELVPIVDITNKKIVINPIPGLLGDEI